MKKLNFINGFKSFLYDTDNFISIYDNYLHVFNYEKIDVLKNEYIEIKIKDKKVYIYGNNLKIKKLTKNEILILGVINKLEFYYE